MDFTIMTIIPINYNQFMNSKRILHSDYVDNFSDGIKFYIQKQYKLYRKIYF